MHFQFENSMKKGENAFLILKCCQGNFKKKKLKQVLRYAKKG